jgi:hypothetical protein
MGDRFCHDLHMSRTPLTRNEFLKFNPRWARADIAVLEEDLDTFGGVTFEHVVSGYNVYISVYDADGSLLMDVSRGTMYYANGRTRPGSMPRTPGSVDHTYKLSTHRAGGGEARPELALQPLCSNCFLHHPEGNCDR